MDVSEGVVAFDTGLEALIEDAIFSKPPRGLPQLLTDAQFDIGN